MDKFIIGQREFGSRLIVGTGKYRDFKQTIELLVTDSGTRFANFEDLVPAEYWGRMKSRNLGDDPEIDFMHFQGHGHELLAAAVHSLLVGSKVGTAP